MTDLTSLTATTGDSRLIHRSEVAESTISMLQPIIAQGGGQIIPSQGARLPWWLRIVEMEPWSAYWYLRLGQLGPHLIEARQCWDADHSEMEWDLARAEKALLPLREPLALTPPPTPWLVVWLGSAIGQIPRDQVGMLGDFERCLAWAMIES